MCTERIIALRVFAAQVHGAMALWRYGAMALWPSSLQQSKFRIRCASFAADFLFFSTSNLLRHGTGTPISELGAV
jgi:hypothetical protein